MQSCVNTNSNGLLLLIISISEHEFSKSNICTFLSLKESSFEDLIKLLNLLQFYVSITKYLYKYVFGQSMLLRIH